MFSRNAARESCTLLGVCVQGQGIWIDFYNTDFKMVESIIRLFVKCI